MAGELLGAHHHHHRHLRSLETISKRTCSSFRRAGTRGRRRRVLSDVVPARASNAPRQPDCRAVHFRADPGQRSQHSALVFKGRQRLDDSRRGPTDSCIASAQPQEKTHADPPHVHAAISPCFHELAQKQRSACRSCQSRQSRNAAVDAGSVKDGGGRERPRDTFACDGT